MSADHIFDGIAELGRVIAANRAAERQAVRDARNSCRRARYAATKHLPRPAKPSAILPGDEYGDLDAEPFCTCYRSAPCQFCVDQPEEH